MLVNALARHRSEQATTSVSARGLRGADIVIGLVNIMPNAAMKTIEALFLRLLATAAPAKIHLRLFTIQDGPHELSEAPQGYEGLNALWDSPHSEFPLDALIVTGTESRTRLMADEPCWPALRQICDWAGKHTISTIWSCFSAHAAVQHLDNIQREPLAEKLSGIFECERASGHPILKNMPRRWCVPHSRYNNLDTAELEARGYEILSRSTSAGADSFIKQHGNSQFLFLQGHLEYGPEMLLGEYCRDLKRFALGVNATCPRAPENYLDQKSIEAFAALQNSKKAMSSTDLTNAVTASLNNDWQAQARQLFNSWLSYVAEQKSVFPEVQFPAGAFTISSETLGYIARS